MKAVRLRPYPGRGQEEGGEDSMKYLKKIRKSLLLLSVIVFAFGQNVLAADEEYTYTVRFYAGNQGQLTGNGISAPSNAKVSKSGTEITITGLKYGDTLYMNPQDAAKSSDSKYYVKGIRRSGRDNSEATESSFRVASDRDYVIAYGISGSLVSYKVNYLDEDGNELLRSDTYYGNPGERQYVSCRYVEGYQPQALNLVKTLSTDESKNVFDFQYTPVAEEEEEAPAGTAAETPAPAAPAAGGTAAAPAGGAAAAPAGGAAAPADGGAGEAAAPEDTVGGDAAVPVPDEQTPQALQDLDQIDDEAVPQANLDASGNHGGTRMGYLPVYIGIGAAAVAALAITVFYLKRRQKALAAVSKDTKIVELPDDEK